MASLRCAQSAHLCCPIFGTVLIAGVMFSTSLWAQSPARGAGVPRFEVAAIKPCKLTAPSTQRGGANGSESSAGTLNLNCQTVSDLIRMAYVFFAGGHVNPAAQTTVSGGPKWIESEAYSIAAKVGPLTKALPGSGLMRGPMLQKLLEERFKLRIVTRSTETPVYELIVASGGAKLPRFVEGSCNPVDFTIFPPEFPENPCPSLADMMGGNITVDARGTTIAEFCTLFLKRLDRPVVNKTGIQGRFDVHLVYSPDLPTDGGGGSLSPSTPDGSAASIYTALRTQLGLQLRPAKGTSESLFIEHVERPSAN